MGRVTLFLPLKYGYTRQTARAARHNATTRERACLPERNPVTHVRSARVDAIAVRQFLAWFDHDH